MPIGAFTASNEVMALLQDNPKLGHITTFGGNPVIAAAALATLQELTETDIIQQTLEKEKLFRKLLIHPKIKEIRGRGLMLAAMLETPEIATEVILECRNRGLVLFWLLFEGRALRITPPLTISNDEIAEGCKIVQNVLNRVK
jgi:acetylornithine/succinyldiaminopimelate/putrescine aminotransferase